MATNAVELENLVIRITGDSSQYTGSLRQAQTQTEQAAAAIQRNADLMSRGAQVTQSVRTASEMYAARMRELRTLLSSGAINQETFNRAVVRAKTDLQGAGQAGQNFGFGMRRWALHAIGAMAPLTGIVSGLGSAFKGVQLAAETETALVGFEVLLKSADRAKTLLEELIAFGAATPFELPELQQAARSLLAFGITAEDIIPTLTAVGDVSSGVQAPLNDIAQIFGKAKVQGRLFMEDINQLTGRGIPVIQELAKQFGVAESGVRGLVETGQINFTHLEQAFKSLTSEGGQFAGMMERQSKTVTGLFSTMKDAINGALRALGEIVIETFRLKDVMNTVIGIGAQVEVFLRSIPPELKPILAGIAVVLAAVTTLSLAWPFLAFMAGAALRTLVFGVDVLLGPVNLLGAAVIALGAGWVASVGGIENALKIVRDALANVWERLRPVREAFTDAGRVVLLLIRNFEEIAIAASKALAPALEWLGEKATEARDSLLGLLQSGVTAIKDFVVQHKEAITTVGLFAGVILSAYGAFHLFSAGLGLVTGLLVTLKIAKLASIAAWVLWKGAVLAATAASAAWGAVMTIGTLAMAGASIAADIYAVQVLIAKAATWLFNAALVAMNALLAAPVILAAIATLGLVAATFAVVAAAVWSVYSAVRSVFSALEVLPTATGPIGAITSLFQEWWEILKEVASVARTDLPRAWNLLRAGFELAVLQVKDMWGPLWTFIQEGFSALWDLTTKELQLAFARTLLNIAQMSGGLIPGMERVMATIDRIMGGLQEEALATAQERLQQAIENFSFIEGEATQAARRNLEAITAEIRQVRTLMAGIGAGMGMAMEQAHQQAAWVGGIGVGMASMFEEAITPVEEVNDGLDEQQKKLKEVKKQWEHVIFGSAEALTRITEYREMLEAGRPARPSTTAADYGPGLTQAETNAQATQRALDALTDLTQAAYLLNQALSGIPPVDPNRPYVHPGVAQRPPWWAQQQQPAAQQVDVQNPYGGQGQSVISILAQQLAQEQAQSQYLRDIAQRPQVQAAGIV